MLALSIIKEVMPINRTGVQKQCSALTEARKLVSLFVPIPTYYKIALAFLCEDILSSIWEKIVW